MIKKYLTSIDQTLHLVSDDLKRCRVAQRALAGYSGLASRQIAESLASAARELQSATSQLSHDVAILQSMANDMLILVTLERESEQSADGQVQGDGGQ